MDKFKRELIRELLGYSGYTVDFMESKPIEILLTYVHPIDRKDFETRYKNLVNEEAKDDIL